ncbi:MAG: PIN domain-containing protein [Chloroflexi bacterium]|nr:PIN domain-containing protein [Chloroflexota bacterium]
MYTIDASVWVNSFDEREAGSQTSRAFLQQVATQQLPVFVPYLLLVEVAGAISRARQTAEQAQQFSAALRALPNVAFIGLQEELTQEAVRLAAQHRLRGVDAIYAAVALYTQSTLISPDQEHLTRLQGVLKVESPQQALPTLGHR